MLKVGDRVEFLKDVEFEYGTVAKKGEKDVIYKIDEEGYWLKGKEIYIGQGNENEYLKKV